MSLTLNKRISNLIDYSCMFVPIQTTVEEIVFRGYLMQGFGHWLNSRFMALFLTSVIFGSLHIANPEITALDMVLYFYT